MDIKQLSKSEYRTQLEETTRALTAQRKDPQGAMDTSLEEFVRAKWDVSMEAFYADLGIDPQVDNVNNLYTSDSTGSTRWIVPEIYMNAIRLGLRKSPIYPSITAAEQSIAVPLVQMPYWNMSDAAPKKLAEGETIKLGTLSFGSKSLTIGKMGRGFASSYEAVAFTPINMMGIWLQDFGVKLGTLIDNLAINCLVNGEQATGSESAAVIGVESTASGLAYADLLRMWIRLDLLGKKATALITGEANANKMLNLAEFKTPVVGSPLINLDIKTPIPKNANVFVHGAVAANQTIVVDKSSAMIKFNAQSLLIESEKIVSNQTEAIYATLMTGFGIVYRDARVVVDSTLDYNAVGDANKFPTWMDPNPSYVQPLTRI